MSLDAISNPSVRLERGDPRPSKVTDAVVVAITRQWLGPTFDPDDKQIVSDVLAAGLAAGYSFTWADAVAVAS